MGRKPAKAVRGAGDSDADRFFRVVAGLEKRLETRLKALEHKVDAVPCGAQAQMERDRQAEVFERMAGERPEGDRISRPPALDESADFSP